jgi:hypothetical protein
MTVWRLSLLRGKESCANTVREKTGNIWTNKSFGTTYGI